MNDSCSNSLTPKNSPQTNKPQPSVSASPPKPTEIIELDDDDDNDEDKANDEIFNFDTAASPEPPSKATEKAAVATDTDTNEQITNPSVNEPKTAAECPVQQQQQCDTVPSPAAPTDKTMDASAVKNIAPTQPTECVASKSNDANNNQPSAKPMQQQSSAAPPKTTTATTPSRKSGTRFSGGANKRKFMKPLQPVYRHQPIQYLPSSDEDDDVDGGGSDVLNKKLKLNEKENKKDPAESGVQANAGIQKNPANVRRLSEIDDNVIQTGNASSNGQHGVSAKESHSNSQKANDNRNTSQSNQREKTTSNAVQQTTNGNNAVQIQSAATRIQQQNNNSSESEEDSDTDSDSSQSIEILVFPD